MQPYQVQAGGVDHVQRHFQIGMPDTVLAVLAAGVGLVAVAVAESRVNTQPDAVAGRGVAKLPQHVDGAGVHWNAICHYPGQRGMVQQIGCEHQARRVQISTVVAGGMRALDLAE